MRHICVVLLCFAFFLFLATHLIAQDKPLAEVTGAYEFNHLSLSADGQSASDNFPAGFDGSLNVPVTRWFGAVGDFGYVRKTYTTVVGTTSVSSFRSSNRTGTFRASGSRRKGHGFAHGMLAVRAVRRTSPNLSCRSWLGYRVVPAPFH